MNRVAAIDIGTNSVRLLVLDADGNEVCREMHITRLGQGVDDTRLLQSEAIERTVSVLAEYGQLLKSHKTQRLRVTATSAARDAGNRDSFFAQVKSAVGASPELLSGEEEAKLSFAGATAGLPLGNAPQTQVLVFDIGGGSTEFALGGSEPSHFLSLNMGGVRVTERFLKSDPLRAEELAAAEKFVQSLLTDVLRDIPVEKAETWIGLAGTVTSVAALAAGLECYTPTVTHGFRLSKDDMEQTYTRLVNATLETRRELLFERKRADVICGGAVVLRQIFRTFNLQQIVVSEKDILDGLAASLLST